MNELIVKACAYIETAPLSATIDDLLDYLEIPKSDRTGFGISAFLSEVLKHMNNKVEGNS